MLNKNFYFFLYLVHRASNFNWKVWNGVHMNIDTDIKARTITNIDLLEATVNSMNNTFYVVTCLFLGKENVVREIHCTSVEF